MLPAWAPRFALTCWFYGRPRFHPSATVPLPLPVPNGSSSSDTTSTTAPLPLPLPTANGGGTTPTPTTTATVTPTAAAEQEAKEGAWTTLAALPPLPTPPPPQGQDEEGWRQQTIFVAIAAYRDSELGPTLRSLFGAATHPVRVTVGVVWQGVEGVDDDGLSGAIAGGDPTTSGSSGSGGGSSGSSNGVESVGLPPEWRHRVRTLRLPASEAAGPCWARHLGQALWQGERFLLQVDSHTRFRRGWDAYLVGVLTGGGCGPSEGGRRAVLTTYPVGYERLGGGGERVPADVRPTLLCPSKVRG